MYENTEEQQAYDRLPSKDKELLTKANLALAQSKLFELESNNEDIDMSEKIVHARAMINKRMNADKNLLAISKII